MIYGLVLVVHVLIAFFLIAVILLQGGRGGLGEALGGAAAQSLFGGGANTVMTKITAVGAGMFMVTCLSLAALSTQRGQSVIDRLPATEQAIPAALPRPKRAATAVTPPPAAPRAPQAGTPTPQTPSTPQTATQSPASTSSTTK